MKDKVDEMIRETYHRGQQMPSELNRKVLKMAQLKQMEGEKTSKRENKNVWRQNGFSWQGAVVAATLGVLILTAGAGGAYAASHYFGIQDFWREYGSKLSEDAQKLIEVDPEVTMDNSRKDAEILNYKVSSVLCDSKYVTAIVNVELKNPDKYLLVLDPKDLDTPVSDVGIDDDTDSSIEEYCRKKGRIPVQIYLQEKDARDAEVVSRDMKQLSSSEGVIEINAKRRSKKQKFEWKVSPLLMLNGSSESHYDPVIQIRVKDNSTEKTAYYRTEDEEKAPIPGTGVTLKEVKLTTTEVGSYLSVRYEEQGISGDDASVSWLELCDENGKPVSFNGMDSGRCREAGRNEYISEECYETVGLPEKITLSIGDSGKLVKLKKQKE